MAHGRCHGHRRTLLDQAENVPRDGDILKVEQFEEAVENLHFLGVAINIGGEAIAEGKKIGGMQAIDAPGVRV